MPTASTPGELIKDVVVSVKSITDRLMRFQSSFAAKRIARDRVKFDTTEMFLRRENVAD